ncbi:unnamed protein product, partial [Mesorhabditis spiculigera]
MIGGNRRSDYGNPDSPSHSLSQVKVDIFPMPRGNSEDAAPVRKESPVVLNHPPENHPFQMPTVRRGL